LQEFIEMWFFFAHKNAIQSPSLKTRINSMLQFVLTQRKGLLDISYLNVLHEILHRIPKSNICALEKWELKEVVFQNKSQ
jgi:hypothetical protein